MATPLISAAVAAKTKNPQSVEVTNSILKSLTGGKTLNLTDMHGHGLRLKVMWFYFKETFTLKWMKVWTNVLSAKWYLGVVIFIRRQNWKMDFIHNAKYVEKNLQWKSSEN